jgi:hypothetical protein
MLILVVIIGGVLYGLWTWLQETRSKRREHLQAVAAFRWDPNMNPIEFERHCADFLNLSGWAATTTRGSGDQGIDVLAEKAGLRVVLQCKKYGRPVGNKAVQEAHAAKAFARAHKAAVVSNMGYTPAAHRLAKSTGVLLLHFTDLASADQLFGVPSIHRSVSDEAANINRVSYVCPNCRVTLRLPLNREGKVRCPKCQYRFRVAT